MLRRLFFVSVLLFCESFATAAWAATYYISPSGSNSNSCALAQSSETSKQTFSSVWSCLSAGDTLIVADGTYTSVAPPAGKSGSAGNAILVQAQNDGSATLSGGILFKGNSYLDFAGFKFTATIEAIRVNSNGSGDPSHHLTFRRSAFVCSNTASDGACVNLSDGTHHILLEDFWAFGGGRYTVMCYGGPGGSPPNLDCYSNTFRRGVLRQGPDISSGGNPQAGLAIYYANDNIVENVIVLDSIPRSNSSNSAFYLTSHAAPPDVSRNKFYGVIALNNEGRGWYLDHNGTGSLNELRNSVIWDSVDIGVVFYSADPDLCTGNVVDHVTIGSNGSHGVQFACVNLNFTSNLVASNTGFGLRKSGSGTIQTSNYNNFFSNTSGARSGATTGPNDIATNPLLSYILRTESGTACKAQGEGGSDCGADIQKRYENGVLTSTNLWPWPYEDRIKGDMCASVPAEPASNWCTTTKTLTRYVWEYLGNTIPVGIYSTTSPVISGVSATSISGTGATITWTTDEASDTQVDYGATASYGIATMLESSLVSSHSVVLTGLSSNTTYHYRVNSRNAVGNLATSGDMTFSTLALESPVINSVTTATPGLSQTLAAVGGRQFTLTVNGQNYVSASQAFAGSTALTTTFVSTSQLTAIISASLTERAGPLTIKVRNPGPLDSNTQTLNVVERGDLNANRTVNISDALFAALNVGGIIKPALAASLGDIDLSDNVNIDDALVIARYAGRIETNMRKPEIISVSASPVSRGASLTITGSGFASSLTDSVILWPIAGSVARVNLIDAPGATVSSTTTTVPVPNNAVSGLIEVFRLDIPMGSSTFPILVSGTATPLVLSSVSPAYRVVPGSAVVLSGLGFSTTLSDNVVSFRTSTGRVNGTVTAATAGTITVTVPSNATCGDVTVTVGAQTTNSRAIMVSGTMCPLILTDILGTGAAGEVVVLEGTGFDPATPQNNVIQFTTATGTVSATVLQAGETQLHLKVPAGAIEGNVSVSVGTQTSNAILFRPPA